MRHQRFLTTLHFGFAAITGAEKEAGFLGVVLDDYKEAETTGARIVRVLDESPAANAALTTNDVILKIDSAPVAGFAELYQAIVNKGAGQRIELSILRNGEIRTITVDLEKQPAFNPQLVSKDPPRVSGGSFHGNGGIFESDVENGGNGVIQQGGLEVTRNFTQTWSGLLDFHIDRREGHAVLDVSGDVSLAGILYVKVTDITPKPDDKFELIRNARSIKGKFGKLILPPLEKGMNWQIVYDDVEARRKLSTTLRHLRFEISVARFAAGGVARRGDYGFLFCVLGYGSW